MKNGRRHSRHGRIRSGVSTSPQPGDRGHSPWTPAETDAILSPVEHVSTCQTPRARSHYLRALTSWGPPGALPPYLMPLPAPNPPA
jgi:hypothetical protein